MATCRFLENLTLASLVAPMTEQEFQTQYWEQKPLVVHRNDPDYYGDLFTVDDFDEAITSSPEYIKMNDATKAGTSIKYSSVQGLEAVLAGMRDGGTLILEQLQRHEPKLGLLCRLLGQELGHSFETNLYLTPPRGKSSVPHWDNVDVFTLQVWGSKRWKIENERRIFPVRPDKMGDRGHAFGGETTSFTVNQGDLIYIPRGFMHVAECGPEASLHISLGMVPVVLEEFLHAIIKAAVRADENLRVALPLGFTHRGGDRIVTRAIAALRHAAAKTFVGAVLDQFLDELVQTAPIDISGQVAGFFQPTPLTLEDVVGPRPGIVCRMHVDGDPVRLNAGTRSILFPGLFREALDFALNTPSFAIRDISGELEDEEKIVFTERLIQEGILVRKIRAPS